jgi:hypothetical protein
MPDRTEAKQDTRFKKGAPSPNPTGRPKGALNKTTLAAQVLLDGEAEALTRKAIELAKEGDVVALRLCLDRIIPARKDRPAAFEMPRVSGIAEAASAMSSLLSAVASGEVTPSEASEISKVIESYIRAHQVGEGGAGVVGTLEIMVRNAPGDGELPPGAVPAKRG